MKKEGVSQRINRLVLGVPPKGVREKHVLELREEGWRWDEIADLYGEKMHTLEDRVRRWRREGLK